MCVCGFKGVCKFACTCMCNACLPLCVCIDEKTVLMGSGTTITLSPWCFLTLMHTCPHPHPPTSHPSQSPPLPTTNLISGMPSHPSTLELSVTAVHTPFPSPFHPPSPQGPHRLPSPPFRCSPSHGYRGRCTRDACGVGREAVKVEGCFYPSIFIILRQCGSTLGILVCVWGGSHECVCLHACVTMPRIWIPCHESMIALCAAPE